MWIGNADVADVAIIWAKTEGIEGVETTAAKAIRGFLVPTDRPGFEATLIRNKMSLRVARTSKIRLENVPLSADDLLPETDGLEITADLPRSGAVRHRLGRHRRRRGVPLRCPRATSAVGRSSAGSSSSSNSRRTSWRTVTPGSCRRPRSRSRLADLKDQGQATGAAGLAGQELDGAMRPRSSLAPVGIFSVASASSTTTV